MALSFLPGVVTYSKKKYRSYDFFKKIQLDRTSMGKNCWKPVNCLSQKTNL